MHWNAEERHSIAHVMGRGLQKKERVITGPATFDLKKVQVGEEVASW
jgi:hypothetical protein